MPVPMEPETPEPYVVAAAALTPRCVFVDGAVDRAALDHNVAQCVAETRRVVDAHGARLIVFPQFGLSGHAMVPAEAWHEAALDVQGPEIERIAEVARSLGVFIAVQVPERHPSFPGRYFLSCVIVGPQDGVVLVHRKGYSLSLRTSPVDVHDKFVDVFGAGAFHPVADTAIGRLGATIGAELHWPEAGRSLALQGVDVIVNPIAAAPHLDYLHRAGAQHVRSVRAFENMTYLITANIGAPDAPPSVIHDFKGAQMGGLCAGDPAVTLATVDLGALRSWRDQPSANLLAQIQARTDVQPDPELHWPVNRWPDHAPARFDDLVEAEAAVWQGLRSRWGR